MSYKLSALALFTLALALSGRLLVSFRGRLLGYLDCSPRQKWRVFPFHQPRGLWLDLLVVALHDADFLEATALVKSFSITVGHLYVQIDRREARFRSGRRSSFKDLLDGERPKAKRAVRLLCDLVQDLYFL